MDEEIPSPFMVKSMSDDPYVKDPEAFARLEREMYDAHPPVTLSSEYGYMVDEDLLGLLIRLARYKFIARQVKTTDRVLEIGCGSGLGAVFLGQRSREVVGLEIKPYEVKDAARSNRRKNVTILEQDFFDYDEQEKFDVVALVDVFEHLPEPEGRRMLEKAARHLNPKGLLALGTPSVHSYPLSSPISQAGHVRMYDGPELQALVEEYFGRSLFFSMNDEMVHTGHPQMAWYYFVLAFAP